MQADPSFCCHAAPAGVFNAFRGTYEIKVWPQAQQTYLAVLSLRHPNVSTSQRLVTFRVTAALNPEAAVAAPGAGGGTTTTGGGASAALLAAAGPVFNPLLNPRISMVVTFPAMDATTYGGGAPKLLADFSAIVAATAALVGPEWVVVKYVNTTPATLNATVRRSLIQSFVHFDFCPETCCLQMLAAVLQNLSVSSVAPSNHSAALSSSTHRYTHTRTHSHTQLWFPPDYASLTSPFEGLCAMDYFLFLLNNLPKVAFSRDGVVGIDATGVKVGGLAPGRCVRSCVKFGFAAALQAADGQLRRGLTRRGD